VVPPPPEPPPPAPPPVYQAPAKTPAPPAQLAPDSPAAAIVAGAVAALPEAKPAEAAKTVEELLSMRQITVAFCQGTFFLNNWMGGKYVYGLSNAEAIGLPPPTEARVSRSADLMQPLVQKWVGKHVGAATLLAFMEIHAEHFAASAGPAQRILERKRQAATSGAAAAPAAPAPSGEIAAPAPAPSVPAGTFGSVTGARVQSVPAAE